ncbi:activated RNA polymerase II transcriptional coactivator p15-like [Physella acuta]|uniref:activated RNA polymerase II transcriptional coactivator p15-like n=1 Tax=Physella acuta TaxID=109671 RepID=UPI0027DB3807|nr:activated RNA polymerase II transcriptional coactivator p15-like [Physella acuta]
MGDGAEEMTVEDMAEEMTVEDMVEEMTVEDGAEFDSGDDTNSDVTTMKSQTQEVVNLSLSQRPRIQKKVATKEKSSAKSSEEKKYSPTKGSCGEFMFQLAKMRNATVSEFRGKAIVRIREYYEKDGELRHGKKCISLSIDQ